MDRVQVVGQSHVPLLQLFQQFVELQESTHILTSIVPPPGQICTRACACMLHGASSLGLFVLDWA